jgi:hypothetical protein
MPGLIFGFRNLVSSVNRRIDHMANAMFEASRTSRGRDDTARDELTPELAAWQDAPVRSRRNRKDGAGQN